VDSGFLEGGQALFAFLLALQLGDSISVDRIQTLREASGNLTAAETTTALSNLGGFETAIVFLNITTLTLADADDEVDFYLQTTYDDGTTWVDIQNFHFDNGDNGTTAHRISYVNASVPPHGQFSVTAVANPSAGAEIVYTAPTNEFVRIGQIYFELVTDSTVANRTVHLVVDNIDSDRRFDLASRSDQTASQTVTYTGGNFGVNQTVTDDAQMIALPQPFFLIGGATLETETTNLQSGDQFQNVALFLERFHQDFIGTDGTLGDGLKSYGRPIGTHLRIKTAVTGATAPTYAYSAHVEFH
jgi:hypothetical protein